MILCITEKPSVARDIARILGATSKRDGYFESDRYRVTWTFGHLCMLKEPADYTDRWKRWSLGSLPMLPERFGIKVIGEQYIEKQFNVIKSLIGEADEVVNCGDAGQEGELIQRWVMQKAGIKCPVKRLWISSLTDESIKEGFKALKPQGEYDNLYHAGLSRAIGDWILGMNATRLYSLKYSSPGNVLSVGRVQTPTLAMIVKRQREIEAFKAADFWELKTTYRDVTFNAAVGRLSSEQEGKELIDRISGQPFTITDVTDKTGREAPQRLFDLTSLQVEANKKWGWTADETLQRIQSLYEKKVTTYPRVDTTYLSTDIYPKIGSILQRMTPYAKFTAPLLGKPIIRPARIFDNAKVTDHHAIIPTGESPTVLQGDEKKLYHLIAMRFIAAFYPDCVFNLTTVTGNAGDIDFKATGKVITSPGWREIITPDAAEQSPADKDDDNRILPEFTKGESGPHKPSIVKKTTQPPKYYTEATLLRAMESAGKTVDDETLREAMKENGIGRPSTRAAIIETLFKRKYIYRQRKNIIASPAGIQLIDTINQELLKSAKLTGIWENRLRRIERGDYSAAEFVDSLKAQIQEIVINVLSDNTNQHIEVKDVSTAKKTKAKSPAKPADKKPKITSYDMIRCPRCHGGVMMKGRTAFGCSNYRECDFRLPFDKYKDTLSPARLATIISKMEKNE